SQKEFLTVYLMSVYSDKSERAWFEAAWKKSGKKLRLGGCCVRFRKVEDAALEVIGEAIRRMPAKEYIARYVQVLASTGRGPDGKKLKNATRAKRASAKTGAPKHSSTKKATAKRATPSKAPRKTAAPIKAAKNAPRR
ncbi:MAG: hypothetical protein ACO3QC_14705, partial [Phycisphaerales bacterium]